MITKQMFLFYKYPFVRQILQHHVLFADDSCVYDTREKYTDVNCINRFFASADRLNLFSSLTQISDQVRDETRQNKVNGHLGQSGQNYLFSY